MRLLICTQAVDAQDPVLGFFVRWIKEFAKHADKVTVLCLRKGEYDLPGIEVISLGERARLLRAIELCSIALGRRHEYDAVFVHMNPEYIVAAGWLWRLLGKRIALWYTHKSVDVKLRIATVFAHVICTASKGSFRIESPKVAILGHGIDTDLFSPDPAVARESWWLSAGRLTKSKHHETVIREAAKAGAELRIAGDGPERVALEQLAQDLQAKVLFLGGVAYSDMPDLFRRAGLFRHTSETGSLDKVVLEAIACGCPVRTDNPELDALVKEGPDGVREHHSLKKLIPAILRQYGTASR